MNSFFFVDKSYFMENYGTSDFTEEFCLKAMEGFDFFSAREKQEFLYMISSDINNGREMAKLPIEHKMKLLKILVKDPKTLGCVQAAEIFDAVFSFKHEDFIEIAKWLSPKDKEIILLYLNDNDFLKIFSEKGLAGSLKLINFCFFGENISNWVEDFIIEKLEQISQIVFKPRSWSTSSSQHFAFQEWKTLALEYVLKSPYANDKRILISLYKVDKQFVYKTFIPQVPSCQKYMSLL